MYYGGYDGQYQWSIDLSRCGDKKVYERIDAEEVWCWVLKEKVSIPFIFSKLSLLYD
jgi:hypothetical protein